MKFKVALKIILLAVLLGQRACLTQAETNAQALGFLVAVLPLLQDAKRETNIVPSPDFVGRMLSYELRTAQPVRDAPRSTIDYAFGQLDLRSDQRLDADQARRLGEIARARRVIWGNFGRDGDKWVLSVRVMNVATGKASAPLTAAAPDWSRAIEDVAKGVLHTFALAKQPSDEAWKKRRLTSSAQALALVAGADAGGPAAEGQLRRALELDPACALAHALLAYDLLSVGRTDEARLEAKAAVKARPEFAFAHYILGLVFWRSDGLLHQAEEELREAIRLEPGWSDPNPYMQLAEILALRREWEASASVLRRATGIAPYDPEIRARLASAYANLGDHDRTVAELNQTERLPCDDFAVQQILGESYRLVNEIPKAIEHFQLYVAAAEGDPAQSKFVKDAKAKLAGLQGSLAPTFVTTASPHIFTSEELDSTLKRRLTTNEYGLVTIPFGCTAEMAKRAKELTKGASDQSEKAKRLFDGFGQRVSPGMVFSGWTAVETFEKLADLKAKITCQDYTLLYIALARAVGIQAYFVQVDKDYRGRPVDHACAGVVLGGKALLVDPTYRWFGVPHKQFEFVDDLRVVAIYLAESPDATKEDVARKIDPRWARVQYLVSIKRASRGELKRSQSALEGGLKLEPNSWLASYAQGCFEMCGTNWDKSALHFEECLALRPGYSPACYLFAQALLQQGRLAAARDQLETYLQGETEPEPAAEARSAIARIDEKLAEGKLNGGQQP